MKLIKLTSYSDNSHIYININEIGYFYEGKQSDDWFEGKPIEMKHTWIGLTVNDKSDFKVKETPEGIIEKIRRIRNASSTYIIL
jgi:hypothetical protein